MRKTKIICTMGPSTDNVETIKELMRLGMNVARFNFSHQDHAAQKRRFDMVVRAREELGLPIATMLDTKGPEVRLGLFKEGSAQLCAGQEFVLTTQQIEGDAERASITYTGLTRDVHTGTKILIDDGLIELEVLEVTGREIRCRVINGGEVSNSKGVNVPDVKLSMPFISERDRSDILFGIETGFDFIAASFTQSANDVREIRKLLDENGGKHINIIAKIENSEGVANIDEILQIVDGIMVARGDMGVEIAFENLPAIQKMLIKKAYNEGKQVITATQMLESMIKNPRPTRAETTDVANAIYDGTSAIMLSGETAAGAYPLEAVRTMARIAERTEANIDYFKRFRLRDNPSDPDITNAISHATCTTAHDLGAAAIVTVSNHGKTAKMISKYRPCCPIIACSPHNRTVRQLNLSWGVTPVYIREVDSTDALFESSLEGAKQTGIVAPGDLVVTTAGIPLRTSGTTNLMRVDIVK
ncbi:pyruvate kinase [Feifania hominis]|uniref:Pyruvate kinase n=1 Tax=Feifania hominis TaxID=2763660 RepID=A0A926DBX4_9FIRM|nr:pyruvate kinase [Feifania hominis]